MLPDVIITDCDHANVDVESAVLKESKCAYRLLQCKTERDLIDQCGGTSVFLNQYAPISRKVIEALPALRLVVRYGVGVDNVDLDAATAHGVQVCNVPDYGMHEVADQAMTLLLNLTRRLTRMDGLVKAGIWDYSKAIPIRRYSCQTVGIVGLGRIGKQFARRARGFGFRIIATDDKAFDIPEDVEMVSFEQLLRESDIVSIHCPAENNRDLIDRRALGRMKDGAFLINTARGGIVNEKALEEAIASGRLAGAGLDVALVEPMPKEHPLLRHENVLVGPHMAWYSEEAALELKRKAAEEAVRFIRGEAVHYPVNAPEKKRESDGGNHNS